MVHLCFLVVVLVPLQERKGEGKGEEKWFFHSVVEAEGELWNIPKVCSTSTALQNSSSAGDTEALGETAAETKWTFQSTYHSICSPCFKEKQ